MKKIEKITCIEGWKVPDIILYETLNLVIDAVNKLQREEKLEDFYGKGLTGHINDKYEEMRKTKEKKVKVFDEFDEHKHIIDLDKIDECEDDDVLVIDSKTYKQELDKAREEVLLEIKDKFCNYLVIDFNSNSEQIGVKPEITKWVEKELSKLKQ